MTKEKSENYFSLPMTNGGGRRFYFSWWWRKV